MATRKDLLKAHSFFSQRMVSALVNRNPDDQTPPLRKIKIGTFISILLSVLILAGFGVVGLIRPGNSTSWKQDKTIVIDSGSGQVMVFLQGKLYPTYNITSARLAAGGADNVKTVKSKSLAGFPRETTIGIPRAPSELPPPKDMGATPLRVCSVTPKEGQGSRLTTLEIGQGSVPSGSIDFVARSESNSAGEEYLVTGGIAYPMPDHALAIHLGFGEQSVTPGNAWLRALPQGPELSPMVLPDEGEKSSVPVTSGVDTIGDLAHVEGENGAIHYILRSGGLSEISPLEAAVLEASHGIQSTPISAAEATAAIDQENPRSGDQRMPDRLPKRSTIDDPDSAPVCAVWPDGSGAPLIDVNGEAPQATSQSPDPNVADLVLMPSLHGALLRVDSSVGTSDPGTLVTNGRRYGIADMDARTALGYEEVQPTAVSAQVLRLIPEGLDSGQSLSIDAALRGS